MQSPLQVTFRNMQASDAVEANIREKAAKLERFHDRITAGLESKELRTYKTIIDHYRDLLQLRFIVNMFRPSVFRAAWHLPVPGWPCPATAS